MENSFLSKEELKTLGLKSYGTNVLISKKASLYNVGQISIGNDVRIDDFCILSGKITLGNYIHISAGTYLYGADVGIEMKDYSGISSRSAVYAISDDFSGNYMTNSMVNTEYRNVLEKCVTIEKYAIVGTNVTILPGANIAEGCAIGAMSLVNKETEPWGIYVGIPCIRIKERSKELLKYIDK